MAKVVATHGARGATTGHVSGVLVPRGSLGAWCYLLVLLKKTSYLDFREEACTSYYIWRPRCDICYFSISLSPIFTIVYDVCCRQDSS